ncbi:MAG: hypothetical protein A3G34_00845 [Candidatus Lindowbacteria bacterium RIFCSPLOWO2_12_FULL_62_27]|nr:MAG: hypothetical protein A3G34_00845 [Candidatus Lindowbacteria bacterium RIFCSPLOWO2_12_FULL_62_27]
MLDRRGLHVYVHVPFCVDPCGYCNFFRKPYQAELERQYVRGIIQEIRLRIPPGAVLSTLYFGGGTPSLMTPESWDLLLREFSGHGRIQDGAEWSLEANPGTIRPDTALFWRRAGLNRISVGVQSLDDDLLKFLNRIHTADVAIRAICALRAAGWDNINADLIYGIPGQSVSDCVSAVRRLSPDLTHLSAYALTIEPGTPFARRQVRPPPDDDVADQYAAIMESAAGAGLAQYEVSNFARAGRACRHNLNTWSYGTYIGLGPSAVGFDGKRRYKNVSDLAGWLDGLSRGALPEACEERPDESTADQERLMLGLRTTAGLKVSGSESRKWRAAIRRAGLSDCFVPDESRLRVKPDRMALLDEILTRLQSAREARAEAAVAG